MAKKKEEDQESDNFEKQIEEEDKLMFQAKAVKVGPKQQSEGSRKTSKLGEGSEKTYIAKVYPVIGQEATPKKEQKVSMNQNEVEVQIPPNKESRNFNINDIMGDLDRDERGNLIIL